MDKRLLKAHQFCRHGNYSKAINCYRRALHRLDHQSDDYRQGSYMLAYAYVMQAEQACNDLCCLGYDLRQDYNDYYHQAAVVLSQLHDAHFDPNAEGLPQIDRCAMQQVRAAYINFDNEVEDETADDLEWLQDLALQPATATIQ